MIKITVNETEIETDDNDKNLINFLRDDMRLTSVKEGCSEGACGTCMVLVDGKAMRACTQTLGKLDGKKIITVDGLSDIEKAVYSSSFAKAGAVQCGFCTPGMIISAKALLDETSNPTDEQIKKAINGNICRCTGYVKIIDAIRMAAECFNNPDMQAAVGTEKNNIDDTHKILGTGLFADDITVDEMVYAKALRAEYPRARVISIDTQRAAEHPDCVRIITAEDIPGQIKCGHLVKDWDALIEAGEITRYVGDAIAIAVTERKESLDEVLSLINVEYEVLTPMSTPQMSLSPDAPKIHESGNILTEQTVKRGDVDAAIKASKYVVTNHYSLPFTEHAFMEPECAIAIPTIEYGVDGLLLYTGSQSIYDEQREISSLLGIEESRIRIKSMLVGGGFGGKEDMSVQHHAALAAWLVKKPVKIKLSRAESILVHPKRHAMEIDFTTACDENGIITAVKADITADTGAYASLGIPVLQRACTHAGGPYNFQNIDVKGLAVYTNNPPAGAFRGFGVTQTCFAMESNLNQLAELAGISPWEIRYKNAIRPGQTLPNGQIADERTAMVECLLAVKEIYEQSEHSGIACGFKNSGLGVGVADIGRCILSIESGMIRVRCGAACMGQGVANVLKQLVCRVLALPPDIIFIEKPDTARTPNSGTTTASRQTLFSGQAAIIAAKKLLDHCREIVLQSPDETFTNILQSLEGQEYYGEYHPHTDAMDSYPDNPVWHVAYSYAAQVAQLDNEGNLAKITAAYDIGAVINPQAAEGQIEGGILMGAGYALSENFILEDCYVKSKYGTLGLIRAVNTPQIETIFVNNEIQETLPAYGAKGVGELAAIPTAPAIAGAAYKTSGVLWEKLPGG